jgi:hypothetical protein
VFGDVTSYAEHECSAADPGWESPYLQNDLLAVFSFEGAFVRPGRMRKGSSRRLTFLLSKNSFSHLIEPLVEVSILCQLSLYSFQYAANRAIAAQMEFGSDIPEPISSEDVRRIYGHGSRFIGASPARPDQLRLIYLVIRANRIIEIAERRGKRHRFRD